MRWAMVLCAVLLASLSVRGEEKSTLEEVVLIDAATAGIPPGAKLWQIETVKDTAGKQSPREVKDPAKGEAVKRLDGTYVVKNAIVTLEGGKTVRCKLLVSVEMDGTTLQDVRF